jgi:hypothetical protein
LKKLDNQLAEGKISKRQYGLEKRVLDDKLSTIMAADRIKKLQGKDVDEKPLEYWADKKKEDEDTEEKEALIKKYMTTPKDEPVSQVQSSGMSKGKVGIIIFLVAAFFVGTGYGVYVMSAPANNSSGISMTVNDSAFPILNNTTTNTTKSTTSNKTTIKTTTTVKKNTTTPNKSTGNTTG